MSQLPHIRVMLFHISKTYNTLFILLSFDGDYKLHGNGYIHTFYSTHIAKGNDTTMDVLMLNH